MVTVNFTGGRCPGLSGKLKHTFFRLCCWFQISRYSCGASRFVILYLSKKREVEEYIICEVRWRDYYILVTFVEVAVYKLFCFHIYQPVLTRERKVNSTVWDGSSGCDHCVWFERFGLCAGR